MKKIRIVILAVISIIQLINCLTFDETLKEVLGTNQRGKLWTKLLVSLNLNDFCILPRATLSFAEFFFDYYRYHQVDLDYYQKISSIDYFKDKTYEPLSDGSYRIPLRTHRMWLTSPYNPREAFSVISDPKYKERIIAANKQFEESTVNEGNSKWEHYFWVNDKTLIPETVAFFEKNGFLVKEISELTCLDERLREIMNQYLSEDRPGAVADVIRQASICSLGGVYLDIDENIESWDANTHKLFDHLAFTIPQFGDYEVFWTSPFAAGANHPVQRLYLQTFKSHQELENRSIEKMSCFEKIIANVLYDTGPYLFALVYYQASLQGLTENLYLIRETDNSKEKLIKIKDGSEINLRVKIEFQEGTGSWADDYYDNLQFGWLDLN